MNRIDPELLPKVVQAGVLAWVLPGAGHLRIGERGFALVYFAAITFTYAVGMALGGVKYSADPRANPWVFLAELGVGGYTMVCYLVSQAIQVPADRVVQFKSAYPGAEVSQIYLITAGLLNVLAVLDALARAHTGLPTFRPAEPAPAGTAGAGTAESAARGSGGAGLYVAPGRSGTGSV